jgi:dolichol-phosphate mannosyltransferase
MAQISLILPTTPRMPLSPGGAVAFQRALEEAGHEVEVVVVVCGIEETPVLGPGNARLVMVSEPGLAAAAVAGLREAAGAVLLVLDPTMSYAPADLNRVIEPLVSGRAELAVASRFLSERTPGRPRLARGPLRRLFGLVARPITGTSDPMSGLIGLNRSAFVEGAEALRPVGSKFAVELVARIEGRWVEVPVHASWPGAGAGLVFDDLRQLKRLADHRFGNYSRLVQFCAVGASGMVVDLTSYAAFQWLLNQTWLAERTTPLFHTSQALTVSAVLAIWLALSWNFSLNRRLTFSYAREGSLLRQYLTYALSNFLGILVSLSMRLLLPRYFSFFNAHKLAAAVVGIVTATGLSFSLSRWVVFRHHLDGPPAEGEPPSGTLNPIATGPLGAEQGGIGAGQEGVGQFAGLQTRDSDARPHPHIEGRNTQAGKAKPQAIGQAEGPRQVGIR